MSNKPLRALMPEAAAIVDAFRAAGLTDNEAIRQGMQEGTFHARQGEHAVGKRVVEQGVTPVLSFEAEKRLADLWWERSRVLPRDDKYGDAEPRFSSSHGLGESGNRQHTPVRKGRAWQPR